MQCAVSLSTSNKSRACMPPPGPLVGWYQWRHIVSRQLTEPESGEHCTARTGKEPLAKGFGRSRCMRSQVISSILQLPACMHRQLNIQQWLSPNCTGHSEGSHHSKVHSHKGRYPCQQRQQPADWSGEFVCKAGTSFEMLFSCQFAVNEHACTGSYLQLPGRLWLTAASAAGQRCLAAEPAAHPPAALQASEQPARGSSVIALTCSKASTACTSCTSNRSCRQQSRY